MTQLTESVANLIDQLAKLPGIGRKSAERLTYHLLRVNVAEALALADAIRQVRENVHYCRICFNLAEQDVCGICQDPKRDQTLLCVVEQPQDVQTIEAVKEYHGLFHVLGGVIAPLEGIGPDQLRLSELMARIQEGEIKEVILATNPTIEGDTTALYIQRILKNTEVAVTRLASGLPVGCRCSWTTRSLPGSSRHCVPSGTA